MIGEPKLEKLPLSYQKKIIQFPDSMAYRKTGTRDPTKTGTLAGPYENRKSRTLVGPYKNGKTGTLAGLYENWKTGTLADPSRPYINPT